MFKSGKDPRRGKGGARTGAGRPSDELAARIRKLCDRHQLVEFLFQIAAGERVATYVTDLGHCVKVPADIKNRREAAAYLLDRGYGKTPQSLELGGQDGEPLQVNIIQYSSKKEAA